MSRVVVVATSNPGKIREFSHALKEAGYEVAGLEALERQIDVEETGATFEENARLKAEAYSRETALTVLADDSGIEVDHLGGAPGVHSARFGGPGLDDEGRVALLLEKLAGVPDPQRTARFLCSLAVARAGETLAVFDGVVEGRITHQPAGDGGFGYDPVFFHDPIGCTLAQISRAEKQQLSHRGAAIARFLDAVRSGSLTL